MSTVKIQGLRKQFGDQVVLPDFSLEVEEGEFVVLLGPSGCGKTTVLRCVAGLERPSAGRIDIGGVIVEDGESGFTLPVQKRELGFVFQHYALWPHMSVHENVAYPLRVKGTQRTEVNERVEDILALIGLEKFGLRSPAELSGGQQQRVALARALVASPKVLLLDEPLSNLDAQRRNSLRKQLRKLHQTVRTTTLYVTHDQIEALTLADRVVVMREGRIEQIGTPREIFEKPASRFVADFLGYENILPATVTRVDGRFATLRSSAWEGDLPVESDVDVSVGSEVEVAFRAANVSVHAPDDSAAPRSSREARVEDVTFLGDCIEYVLRIGGDLIVARIAATNDPGSRAIADRQRVSVAPQNLILLAGKRTNPAVQAPRVRVTA